MTFATCLTYECVWRVPSLVMERGSCSWELCGCHVLSPAIPAELSKNCLSIAAWPSKDCLLPCHHSKDKTTERFSGFRPSCSEQCLMEVCHQELLEDDRCISSDRHIAVYDPSGMHHLLMWDFVWSVTLSIDFFLFFWTLAKLFLSPSHKPHLLCTSHTTNHKYFYLFIFFQSKMNYWSILGTIERNPSPILIL